MKRLNYIAPSKASFVLQDIAWLSKEYEVRQFWFPVRYKVWVPLRMVILFLQLLFARKAVHLISFGGYHSFVAVLVAKLKGANSFIILNGTDSVSIPEFNYGHLRKGLLRWCCHRSYLMCSKLLPVSDSLIYTENVYAFDELRVLGLKKEFPNLKTPYHVVPNGFETNFWKQGVEPASEKSFITVVGSNDRIVHKGLDLILQVASDFPDFSFYVAGLERIDEGPDNVHFLGYLDKDRLREAYQKSKYYLQLSVWEGFGCALCEAMLSGCMPIVSSVNVLPDIIGKSGWVLTRRSEDKLKILLNSLNNTENEPPNRRIQELFPMKKRLSELIKQLEQ